MKKKVFYICAFSHEGGDDDCLEKLVRAFTEQEAKAYFEEKYVGYEVVEIREWRKDND